MGLLVRLMDYFDGKSLITADARYIMQQPVQAGSGKLVSKSDIYNNYQIRGPKYNDRPGLYLHKKSR